MNSDKTAQSRENTCGQSRVFIISAAAMLAAALLAILFYRGIYDPSEGRYAEAPREMVETGRWMEMRLFGYYYYEKPPLTYWMVAPAIALLGAHDWAVRTPLLINAILLAALFYGLARRHWAREHASMSLLISMATIGFIGGMCMLLTDPFLTLWFGITCACLYWGFTPGASHKHRAVFLVAAAVAAFLGFMTKGAVAVVLPGAIIFFWLLWERRLSALVTLGIPVAAILFLALLAPALWFIEQHNPGFFYHFIYEEHIARFTGTRAMQGHEEPFWFYAYIIPLLMLPWTFFAVRAARIIIVKRVLSRKTEPGIHESNESLTRFLAVWTAVVVVFFSISTGKMMSYIVPAVPAMMLLLARWGLVQPPEGSRADARLWKLGVAGVFMTALVVTGLWFVSFFGIIPDDPHSISGISFLALIPMAVTFGAVARKRAFRTAHGIFAVGSAIMLAVALLFSPLAGRHFNVRAHNNSSIVYKHLASFLEPGDSIIVFWHYRPSLPFYCRTPTILFQTRNELAYGMALEPDRRDRYMETVEEVKELLEAGSGRVFGVVRPRHIESRFLPLGIMHVPAPIPSDPDTVVLQLLPAGR